MRHIYLCFISFPNTVSFHILLHSNILSIIRFYHLFTNLIDKSTDGLHKLFVVVQIVAHLPKDAMHQFVEVGAIPAYAYLGDVTNSVTGDKKAQKFEDEYLDLLVSTLKDLGFYAITYMPSRNTDEQLERIMRLCRENGFFEISGEDINSSRQSFICPALAKPECAHLAPAAHALIGHELASTDNIENGMFTEKTIKEMATLEERIKYFADWRL